MTEESDLTDQEQDGVNKAVSFCSAAIQVITQGTRGNAMALQLQSLIDAMAGIDPVATLTMLSWQSVVQSPQLVETHAAAKAIIHDARRQFEASAALYFQEGREH